MFKSVINNPSKQQARRLDGGLSSSGSQDHNKDQVEQLNTIRVAATAMRID